MLYQVEYIVFYIIGMKNENYNIETILSNLDNAHPI